MDDLRDIDLYIFSGGSFVGALVSDAVTLRPFPDAGGDEFTGSSLTYADFEGTALRGQIFRVLFFPTQTDLQERT